MPPANNHAPQNHAVHPKIPAFTCANYFGRLKGLRIARPFKSEPCYWKAVGEVKRSQEHQDMSTS